MAVLIFYHKGEFAMSEQTITDTSGEVLTGTEGFENEAGKGEDTNDGN